MGDDHDSVDETGTTGPTNSGVVGRQCEIERSL
jgi:hypothetical protein